MAQSLSLYFFSRLKRSKHFLSTSTSTANFQSEEIPVLLFVMLYKVVLTFQTVYENL